MTRPSCLTIVQRLIGELLSGTYTDMLHMQLQVYNM